MYLLSDLFTYYEHDPDLRHDDDEDDAPAGPPTDPPDLTHIAVVPS
jgi:hypothetical protein